MTIVESSHDECLTDTEIKQYESLARFNPWMLLFLLVILLIAAVIYVVTGQWLKHPDETTKQ